MTQVHARRGRPCSVCADPDVREQIETILESGTYTFSGLSRSFGMSAESVTLHTRKHWHPKLRAEAHRQGVDGVALADKLVELLEHADDIRLSSSDASIQLRAIEAQKTLIFDIAAQLGTD